MKFYRYFGGSLLLAGRYLSFGICPQPLSLHSEGCYFRFRGGGGGVVVTFEMLRYFKLISYPDPTCVMDVLGRGRSGYETTSELDFSSRYYNATIIQMAGIQSDQLAIWLAAVVAFSNFMFSIVGVWLVERVGRRKLLLGSLAGVTLFLFLIGGAFYSAQQHDTPISLREEMPLGISNNCPTSGHCLDCLQAKCGFCFGEDDARNYFNGSCIPKNRTTSGTVAAFGRCSQKDHQKTTWAVTGCPYKYGLVAILFLALYHASFQPGLGPMPSTINSEIYPLWARGAGNAFASATNWTCNFLISISFLTLTESITRYGAFWLYGGISICGWVFFFFYLPETKGKSLEQLEHLFS